MSLLFSYVRDNVLGLVSTTSVEWSIFVCFIDFFASLSARLDFQCGKISKTNKECSIPRSQWKQALTRTRHSADFSNKTLNAQIYFVPYLDKTTKAIVEYQG